MRPKKIILCVDQDEDELGRRKYMLEINGYRVITASSVQEAITRYNAAITLDLVLIVEHPRVNSTELAQRMKLIRPYIPLLILAPKSMVGFTVHVADAMVAKTCWSIELLEHIKIMSQRKRGPRKGTQRVVPTATQAVAV